MSIFQKFSNRLKAYLQKAIGNYRNCGKITTLLESFLDLLFSEGHYEVIDKFYITFEEVV
jgi:hypothetical protein